VIDPGWQIRDHHLRGPGRRRVIVRETARIAAAPLAHDAPSVLDTTMMISVVMTMLAMVPIGAKIVFANSPDSVGFSRSHLQTHL
jgi:hypothetical protein